MKSFLLILILFSTLSGKACLNYYYSIDEEGTLSNIDHLHGHFQPFQQNFDQAKLVKQLTLINKKNNPSFKDLSDYAVIIMKLGKIDEAVEILSRLHYAYPDEYQIASNLGTAYELSGNIDSAMKYIDQGMFLNSGAHGGSEWIHLKILETKKTLIKDSLYLTQNTILQLTEEDEKDTILLQQIAIQLHERFPFITPPNPIIADLLIDLGDCYAKTISIEYAKAIYTIAQNYFENNSSELQEKIDRMISLRNNYHDQRTELRKKSIDGDYTHELVSGVRYKTLLKDNSDNSFALNWKNILTDPKTLLAKLNLNDKPASQVVEPVPFENNLEFEKKEESPQKPSNDSLIYLLLLILFGGLAFLFFVIRKGIK